MNMDVDINIDTYTDTDVDAIDIRQVGGSIVRKALDWESGDISSPMRTPTFP